MSYSNVRINIVFNVLKTFTSIIYPLITFVYVARVLSVDGIGQVNFVKSFVSYFTLLSSLGISYYGVREGARVVKDKKLFSKLFYELLLVNIISTVFSIILFISISVLTKSLHEYKDLLIINSISIILSGLSLEWVLAAHEKFKYIAIRTMIIQLACIIAVFIFVRTEEDYLNYAVLLVISGYFSSFINWLNIGKSKLLSRINIRSLSLVKHVKPILLLFAMLVSIDMYTLLDTTMLGFIKSDYEVGIYSTAIKVPRLVNSVIASVGVVLVPRLSQFYDDNILKFYDYLNKLMDFIALVTIPFFCFVLCMSEEIITVLCGEKYIEATDTLRWLSLLIIIIPISVLFNNQVFIPIRKEQLVLKSTCIGAIVNIIANLFLIKRYGAEGAAIASLLAEICVCSVCVYHAFYILSIKKFFKRYLNHILKSMLLFVTIVISKNFIDNSFFKLAVAIFIFAIFFVFFNKSAIKSLIKE